MLLIQEPWSAASDPAEVSRRLAAICEFAPAPNHSAPLVLLPLADPDPVPRGVFTELASTAAKLSGIYFAGAAFVTEAGKPSHIRSVLAGPDGSLLIDVAKTTPELTAGFGDVGLVRQSNPFTVADTSEGRVGILAGEDVLMPHLARAQTLAGAEIILNPSRELSDRHLQARLRARRARSYENIVFVATASPRCVTTSGASVALPGASMVSDQWGKATTVDGQAASLSVPLDIEGLRRRRQETRANFPAIVRTAVYEHELDRHVPTDVQAATQQAWQTEGKKRAPAIQQPKIDNYGVVLCQHVVHQSRTPDELVPNRTRNVTDALALAGLLAKAPDTKLVVLPEFFITGPVSPLGDQLAEHAEKIGIEIPGPETEVLGEFAKQHGVYLTAGCFEYDPDWPERFFNTGFILNDKGELILKYRKIHCGDVMGFLPDTTPGSVFTDYVGQYGKDALFPVVDTPLGRLGVAICFDMNFPETFRALAHRGAEVIIHPTSEPHNRGRLGWEQGRHTRAFENLTYILSCGHGGEYFGAEQRVPTARARGYSRIVDFNGETQVVANGPGRVALPGTIELSALRRERANPARNYLLWDDPSVYVDYYRPANEMGLANDLWRHDPRTNPYRRGAQIQAVVSRYNERGIFTPPTS